MNHSICVQNLKRLVGNVYLKKMKNKEFHVLIHNFIRYTNLLINIKHVSFV